MKGKMKKLFALALAAIMVLAMGMNALAAESDTPTGKITVNGANPGTYYAYKIFDGTASANGGMSYTVSGKALTYMSQQAGESKIIKNGDTVLFTLVNNGGATYVNVGNADAAAAWVQEHINDLLNIQVETDAETGAIVYKGADASAVTNTSAKTVTFDNLVYGYYYVITGTETAGSAVMLTSVNGNVSINEKHGTPGFDPKDPKDGKHADKETYQIGEKIKYTVQFSNALNYVNGKLITNYTVKDVLAKGIELLPNSVHVYVDNAKETGEGNSKKGEVALLSTEANADKIVGEIAWAKEVANADGTTHLEPIYVNAPSVITIEYEVLVTKDFKAGDEGVTNTVEIGYVTEEGKTPENPPKDDETVYTGKVEIEKVDARNPMEKLEGAVFVIEHLVVLKGEDGEEKTTLQYMTKDVDNAGKVTIGWTTDVNANNIYKATTDKDGLASFEGLAAGTYTLREIEAPEGYNLMENGEEFVLTAPDKDDATLTMVYASTITNNKGTLLPSTGGIGTTIFYVVGSILMLGAVVLFVTKKRSAERR